MFRALFVALPFVLSAAANATPWVADEAHTNIGFTVKHMMVTDVRGTFDKYSVTIDADEKDVTKSKITVKIDPASINTRNAKRDEHLRSPDFFDVAKFPELTFTSTKIEKMKDGKLAITGDLNMHGVKKSVVLNADAISDEYKDPWGGMHRGTKATLTINREDFGLKWNKTLDKAGGLLVGKDVVIDIQVELMPAPPPAKT